MEASGINSAAPTIPQSYVTLLTSHLNFGHTPKGLAQKYLEATTADDTSTDQVFLTAGFPAWFAYFLAKRAATGTTHFDGQAACNQQLNELSRLSLNEKRQLAALVLQSIPAEVKCRFQAVYSKAIMPQSSKPQLPKRRRLESDDDPPPSPSSVTVHAGEGADDDDNPFTVENAAASELPTVFPTYLAGAIRTYQMRREGRWAAAITMSFPDRSSFGNKFGSMMSLEITTNKVERLAEMLFGAHVESKDQHRYLVLPNGVKIQPAPEHVLRGCKREIIPGVFGVDTDNGVKVTPAYKEEMEKGDALTESVTMILSDKARDGAVINVSLDEKEAFRLKRKLYPPKQPP